MKEWCPSISILLSGCLLFLTACSTLPEQQSISHIGPLPDTGQFGPRPTDIPTSEQLHRLTNEQEAKFLEYFQRRSRRGTNANRIIADYLTSSTEGFNYEGDTFDASHTLAFNTGNCMSLAILTTALAQLADVRIGYQLIDDVPVYEFEGQLVKKGVHIRTILYKPVDPAEDSKVFRQFSSGIKVDYFPTKRQRFIANVSEADYLSMYYQNMAVEAIDLNDLNRAYWFAMEALDLTPLESSVLNLLAVTNRRAGNHDVAEQLYLYGIEHAENKLTLLKNYRELLVESGRLEEAEKIGNRLLNMGDDSPMNWYLLGRSAYESGSYDEAIRYFRRALDLAPYLHEAHLGIAQASYLTGRLASSERAFEDAINTAQRVSTKKLYEAKLLAFRPD